MAKFYKVKPLEDSKFYRVVDISTSETVLYGTRAECRDWVKVNTDARN